MLLTITSTTPPAGDLGFILHKHPDRVQDFSLPFGRAHVFYPEATSERTTAALLVEIDPVALVKRRGRDLVLNDYVNDRPYVASSFMSVAIARVFGSALRGKSEGHEDLVDQPMSITAQVAVVASYDGEEALHRLFEPLGYTVTVTAHRLNERFESWGDSPYYSLTLEGEVPVKSLLGHLYVLLPVLDGAKHYWVDESEIDKLLRSGEEWLSDHPEREVITRRYLKGQRSLTNAALDRLLAEDVGLVDQDVVDDSEVEDAQRVPLNRLRMDAVIEELKRLGARRILDLGCGEGRLIGELLRDPSVAQVTGMDVSVAALRKAARRLRLDEMSHRQRERVALMQGSLTYRDKRLSGFDAAAVVEVVEHLDLWQLGSFERALFGEAHPGAVVLTTPNAEYNVEYERMEAGSHRHLDHRFEWTRAELAAWAAGVCERNGYSVEFRGIGEESALVGSPTQMAVFRAGERQP
ncbi:MAG: 3' terminal RNA ribose 2'-O-methyltransferase Hen1 [bacterium]|nr:3' terminal RNA ribose 2'-O-methyltransferase Hen1 [bacterium]